MITRTSVLVALATAGLLLAGCSKKDEGAATTAAPSAEAPVATATAAPTPTPVPTHAPPVTTTVVQNQSIDSCCGALASAAKSSKDPVAKAKLTTQAGVCSGIAPKVKSGATTRSAGLTQVKSGLAGTTIPPECN
jgi:hypothetical protein